MWRQGNATPGEYASDRSRCVVNVLVAEISILPGLPCEWNSRASSSVTRADPLSMEMWLPRNGGAPPTLVMIAPSIVDGARTRQSRCVADAMVGRLGRA